jgi:hypothetical protein
LEPCAVPRSPSPQLRGLKFTDIEGGFPHSEILGSKLVRSSPRLIAAYHVLHRLLAPRHPPDTLIALDCSHYRCPPSLFTSAEEKESLLFSCEISQTRLLKTSYCFEHIRGQSGQACPRLVCMILSRSFRAKPEGASPQIRDHPDMFPLHDVLEPANPLISAHCVTNGISETFCMDEAAASAINRKLLGGARRDRTDDLMLAKHALSQLSYGPSRRTEHVTPNGPEGRKAERPPRTSSRKARRPETDNGGPGKTRTSDLTLIKRAL